MIRRRSVINFRIATSVAVAFIGASLLLASARGTEVTPRQPAAGASEQHDAGQEYSERDEIRQSHRLTAGARVEVASINGPVVIETADIDTAEVHVVRSAPNREDLRYRRIEIAATPSSLTVKGVRHDDSEPNVRVRHRVVLRVPRRIELSAQSINGGLEVGAINGSVAVRSINGGARIAGAAGHAEITSINGGVTLTMAHLAERGIRMRSINGGIELRFAGEVNADLEITRMNGGLTNGLPNLFLQQTSQHQTNFRARIGAGGIPITIANVNGGVRLARAS